MFGENRDTDFPFDFRPNNGKYLVILSKGLYLYNSDHRIIDSYEDTSPMNISQFFSEEGGYVVCLINQDLYLLSY